MPTVAQHPKRWRTKTKPYGHTPKILYQIISWHKHPPLDPASTIAIVSLTAPGDHSIEIPARHMGSATTSRSKPDNLF